MRVFRGWDIMKVLIHFLCKLYWTSSCGWETSKLIWTVAHCNWIVILVFYRMVFYEIVIGILRSEKVPKEQNVWKGTQKVRLLGVWWKFYYSSCGLPCHKTSIIICTSQTRYATNIYNHSPTYSRVTNQPSILTMTSFVSQGPECHRQGQVEKQKELVGNVFFFCCEHFRTSSAEHSWS